MPTPDEPTTEVRPTQPGLDDFDLDFEDTGPPPRRRRLPFLTGALALCAAIGGGVVLGIVIQKHWGDAGSTGGGATAASLAAALGDRSGQSGGSTGGAAAPGGFARSGTAGQVKAIDGTSLYITDTDGNVVKVTTDPGVTVRVTKDGTLKSIAPGDFVVVQGTKTKSGYRASSITNSGTSGGLTGALGAGTGTDGNRGGSNQPTLPGLP